MEKYTEQLDADIIYSLYIIAVYWTLFTSWSKQHSFADTLDIWIQTFCAIGC